MKIFRGGTNIITGALINAAAILLGGGVGLLFRGRLSNKIAETITRAMGLCVLVIGISGALKGDMMLLVVSLAAGAFTGGLVDIDGALNRLGLWLQSKFARDGEKSAFAEGFVAATLLFCVGAMAIVGSIDSGLGNGVEIIVTKSIIDGVTAVVFASSFGFGVLFSALPVLIYQGGIEFFAGHLQNVLTDGLITQISAAGSVMIMGIGLNMAAETKIKSANMLPGLIFAVAYYYLVL